MVGRNTEPAGRNVCPLCSGSIGSNDLEAFHLWGSEKQFFRTRKESFGDLSREVSISALGLGKRVKDAELALPNLKAYQLFVPGSANAMGRAHLRNYSTSPSLPGLAWTAFLHCHQQLQVLTA